MRLLIVALPLILLQSACGGGGETISPTTTSPLTHAFPNPHGATETSLSQPTTTIRASLPEDIVEMLENVGITQP